MHSYKMTDEEVETVSISELPSLETETNQIMKSEFWTGLLLSIIYLGFVFLIPILNWYFKSFAFKPLFGGMSVSWFLTSIVAMAMAFLIAFIHTKLYEKRLEKYHRDSTNNKKRNEQGGYSA